VYCESQQLKLTFNKSGQSWFSARTTASNAAKAANENRASPRHGNDHVDLSFRPGPRPCRRLTGFRAFWREFFAKAFNPYRPELHYMRGPGPAWHAKYGHEASFRLKSGDI